MKSIGGHGVSTDWGAADRASCVQLNKNPRVQAMFGEYMNMPSFGMVWAFSWNDI